MCLGEVLAKMEIFLYFTSLLHVFDISVPEGKELPNLKGFSGVTITPESFEVKIQLFLTPSSLMFVLTENEGRQGKMTET